MDELSLYYGAHTGGEIDNAVSKVLDWDSAGIPEVASPNITGTTNDTGATITAGTFFYVNGTLVTAKTDIADNAPLNEGTNYEAVTAGGLNAVKLPNNALVPQRIGTIANNKSSATITFPISTLHVLWFATGNANKMAEILVGTDSASHVYLLEIAKGANISFSANNDLTVTVNLAATGNTITVADMPITGSAYPTIS